MILNTHKIDKATLKLKTFKSHNITSILSYNIINEA